MYHTKAQVGYIMNNDNDLLDKAFGVANPPDNKKYDLTRASVWMSKHAFGIDWAANGIGFGQVIFEIGPKGQVHIDTEHMSDQFIEELVLYVLSNATKDQQKKDWKTVNDYYQEGAQSDQPECPYTDQDAIKYWTLGYQGKTND